MGWGFPCIIRGMMKRKNFTVCLAAAFMAAVLSGCEKIATSPDVVLVTVDGNLPVVESLEKDGAMLFTDVYTTSPSTLPAAASVLTGLVPVEHGLRVNGVGSLAPGSETLASALDELGGGYRCGAFLSTTALSPVHGLTNGFETYEAKANPASRVVAYTTPPAALVDSALAFAKAKDTGKKPVFVWVHLSPFAGVNLADSEAVRKAEAEAMAQIDRLFGEFKADHSVRAVVPLYGIDADAPFAGMSLDEKATRVTVGISGLSSGVYDKPFSVAGVKRVILDAVERLPFSVDVRKPVYSETLLPWYVFRLPALQVARGGVGALPPLGLEKVVPQVMAGQAEMVVLKMNGHLGEGLIPSFTNASASVLGDAGLKLIQCAKEARSMAGTNAIASVKALAAEGPETPIFHEWLGDLQWQAKNYMEACNAYGKASEHGINMISAYRQQSRCHLVIGNIPMAIDKAENAFLLNPEDPVLRHELSQLLINVGGALLAKKDFKSASECLNRVAWLEPRNTEAMIQLSRLQLEIGQTNNAIGLLKSALNIKPDHPIAKRMLGKLTK